MGWRVILSINCYYWAGIIICDGLINTDAWIDVQIHTTFWVYEEEDTAILFSTG